MDGNPVVTPMDIAWNGDIMEDVYGSMEEYWEEQDEESNSNPNSSCT